MQCTVCGDGRISSSHAWQVDMGFHATYHKAHLSTIEVTMPLSGGECQCGGQIFFPTGVIRNPFLGLSIAPTAKRAVLFPSFGTLDERLIAHVTGCSV